MRLRDYLFSLTVVSLLIGGLMYVLPPPLRLAWGIGWLVTLAVGGLYELKMARLEQRAIGIGWMTGFLLLLLWPGRLILWLLMFYGMWMRPRWEAQYERERPERERREQERLARMIASDAARTNPRCGACGKPVPSYRKTCRHCQAPFAAPIESGSASA